MNTSKQILAIAADQGSCGNWRILTPYRRFDINGFHAESTLLDIVPRYEYFDIVIIQRPIAGCIEWIQSLKAMGKKVLIELDDMYPIFDTENPTYHLFHPDSEASNHVLECVRLSDGVMTSTEELKAYYGQYSANVGVFRNAIDVLNPIYRHPLQRPTDKITMFWSGSSGHGSNLRVMKSAVEQACREFPQLLLAICADKALLDMFEIPEEQKLHIPERPFHSFMNVQSIADFSMAPLQMNPYNDGKSEIRILESAMWKVPVVASPSASYERFHNESQGACKLATTDEEWLDAIRFFTTQETARKEMGKRAYSHTTLQYNLSSVNIRRKNFFAELLAANDEA